MECGHGLKGFPVEGTCEDEDAVRGYGLYQTERYAHPETGPAPPAPLAAQNQTGVLALLAIASVAALVVMQE